jgi:hypothetical protein
MVHLAAQSMTSGADFTVAALLQLPAEQHGHLSSSQHSSQHGG